MAYKPEPAVEVYWHTREGRRLSVDEMDEAHAKAVLRLVLQRQRKQRQALASLAALLRPYLKAMDEDERAKEAKLGEDIYNEVMGEDKKWGSD